MIVSAFKEFQKEYSALRITPKRLKEFGLLVGGLIVVFAALSVWRHGIGWGSEAVCIAGLVLMVCGFVLPRTLSGLYRLWMGLALVLGLVVGTVLLFVLFYLVVAPIGLLQRFFGSDPLERRIRPEAESYWQPHAERSTQHMRRPF